MSHNKFASQSQDAIQTNSQIDAFFKNFTIGTLLDRAGIRKRHGYRVYSLIKTIFTLPFIGKNFFRGIVINKDVDFGIDAAYQVLKYEMPVDDDHTVDDCVGLIIGRLEKYYEEQCRSAGTFFMNAGFSRHWQDLLYKIHGVSFDAPILVGSV